MAADWPPTAGCSPNCEIGSYMYGINRLAAGFLPRDSSEAIMRLMRRLMLMTLAVVAAMTAAGTSHAQNYAWCLVNDLKFGSTTCAFVSREQCMMSTGGNVGHCVANPAYAATPQPPHKRRPPAR